MLCVRMGCLESARSYLNIIASDKICALPTEMTSFINWIFPFEKLRSDPSFHDEFVLAQYDRARALINSMCGKCARLFGPVKARPLNVRPGGPTLSGT